MNIYILENKSLQTSFIDWLSILNEEDRLRISTYSSESARVCSLASRLFIKSICGNEDISFHKYGKPYINGIELNISHCLQYTVMATDSAPVGIDIEDLYRKSSDRLIRHVLTEKEQSLVASGSFLFPYLWTRKEAVLKCNGCGITVSLDSVPVIDDQILFGGYYYWIHTFSFCNHAVSVASNNPVRNLNVRLIDVEELKIILSKGILNS